jgi:DNA-binding transcriptional regulator/RsmH inhibitor MraZ
MGKQPTLRTPPASPSLGSLLPKFYSDDFDRVVDASGRVLLPSPWREVGETSFLVVLWPMVGTPSFLRVLPPAHAMKLQSALVDSRLTDPAAMIMARTIGANSIPTQLDSYGRLPIPENAARKVGIKDHVKLVGAVTLFELWNPERYAAQASDPKYIIEVENSLKAGII